MKLLSILLLLCGTASAAGPAADPDALFNKGEYQAALAAYSAKAGVAGEAGLKALYRAAECESLLSRYAEAAKRLAAVKLPKDASWRARLLLLRAENGREFLRRYRHSLPADVQAGTADLTKLTAAQWEERIAFDYDALWELRHELLKRPLSGETYFFDTAKADLTRVPTLWDFSVERWISYLAEGRAESGKPRPALELAAEDYKADYSPSLGAGAKAAAVLEETAALAKAGRETAAALWRIRRVLLPRSSDLFHGLGDAYNTAALALLKKWANSLPPGLARAQAAYEAAGLANEREEFALAVELCAAAVKAAPGKKPARDCESLSAAIRMPELRLEARTVPPPGRGAAEVTVRNLPEVHFRLWQISAEELEYLRAGEKKDFSYLRALDTEAAEAVLKRRITHAWKAAPEYPAPHRSARLKALPPPLKKGLYVLAASSDADFAPGASLLKLAIVNVTDLFLLGTTGVNGDPENYLHADTGALPHREERLDLFHFYAVDALTGQPLKEYDISVYHGNSYSSGRTLSPLRTDAEGRADLSAGVAVKYGQAQYFQADPLLYRGGAFALWAYPQGAAFSVPAPIEIKAETDRPIYRPGQRASFKITVLHRVPRGYRLFGADTQVKVSARDANWNELFSRTVLLNSMGSAAGYFEVPAGRLLGNYTLQVSLKEYGHDFRGQVSFAVEEYKRPEFEVKLGAGDGAFRYGRKAAVDGEVKYYFGSPVPGAKVTYRVIRARHIPWYAWWWRWNYSPAEESEFASGTTATGEDGKFKVEFTPEPESGEFANYPSSFRVEAEAREAGGRTITDSRSYTAGSKAYNFDVTPDAGFFLSDKPAGFEARLVDLGDAQRAGGGSYELYRIDKAPDFPAPDSWGGRFGENPALEGLFAKAPNGAAVHSGKLVFFADKPSKQKLPPLPEGVYRLKLKAEDPWGGVSESAIILVSVDAAKPGASLKLPSVAIFERGSYQPGETARALVGASGLKGVKYMELLAGDFILARRTIPGGGISLAEFKVADAHRGGFALRWFGAGDFQVHSAAGAAAVPRHDRKLNLSLAHDKALEPGAKVHWLLKASDAAGRPADAEATVRIYDRSLDYYAKGAGYWGAALYPARLSRSGGIGSVFEAQVTELPVKSGLVTKLMSLFDRGPEEEKMPAFRINAGRSMRRGWSQKLGGVMSFGANELMMESEDAVSQSAPAGFSARAKSVMPEEKRKDSGGGAGDAAAPVLRSDFSETAYFEPQLRLKEGKASLDFTAPERLSSWKVEAAVITREAATGAFSSETVTRKELMARLELPRFLREGDRSRLTAVLTSQANEALSGEAYVEISGPEGDAAGRFSLQSGRKNFELKPGGTVSLQWPVTAPRGSQAYKVRVVARAGRYTDAQQNDLPVLPSRERLIASSFAALDGAGASGLELKELREEDSSRETEAIHLEVQPQLILSVINSLPYLVRYPYECTEQLLNRYVPLAIVNSFYARYPDLAAATAKLPKRDTLLPSWERDNPVRLMALMETPWDEFSRGMKSPAGAIALLDPKVVSSERESSLEKLVSYQNSDGSFPWFPGGRGDLYITLLVLEGFAEAARYGVQVPRAAAGKALRYVLAELPSRMKPEPEHTSLLLYAAYVVTSFPADWREASGGAAFARKAAQYCEKYPDTLSAFGKAYAAYVWLRLGDRRRADSYLSRAMDGAREDAVSGVYWAPEKMSWVWYNDDVEKHAFILRALLALRPADPKIPGLARWLMFSRKAGAWKSTKASAAAVYSLLDLMKKKGALDQKEKITIKWGNLADSRVLKPFDWLSAPLRWSKYGQDAVKAPAVAKVEKTGPGLAFASLTAVYTSEKIASQSGPGMLNVSRRYFRRVKSGSGYELKPLASGDSVNVGDQLEVHLSVDTRNAFEYVHLKDPRGAGFESEELRSGWNWDGLSRYEEPRDSLTNFFMDRLPHGEYVLKYRVRPSTPGAYRIGAATLQSMYAPEFAAHSAGMELTVRAVEE